jgi:hypothetical protein
VSAAYQKPPQHLLTFLGDAFLGVAVPPALGGRHESQVRPHRAALLEAVGILQAEHEGKRRKRSDSLHLAQKVGFMRVVLFSDRLQLPLVVADALRQRAYLCSKMGSSAGMSASGMCAQRLCCGSFSQDIWASEPRRT